MSITVMASAAHSPGVTSLAVALCAHAEAPTLLVDANREPDQSILAGYLHGVDPEGRGLAGLLQAHRERRPLGSVLDAMTLPLGDSGAFLPGFAHPGAVCLFTPAWPELASALDAEPRDVVIDAGRLGDTGLPPALVTVSDAVLILTRTSLPDLAALRLYLPQLTEAVNPERIGLVLVGPGRPYGSNEIQRRFGVPVIAEIGWHPEDAAVYSHGSLPGRKHATSGYLRDVRSLAQCLRNREAKRRTIIGVRQ